MDAPKPHSVELSTIRSERVVCTVRIGEQRSKVFQVFFGRDGSLFVTFPYFHHRTGILAAATIPANGTLTSQVNLAVGGKIASHLVKYSHHPDGRAHFSQTGKVFTAIRRQSIALDLQHGHMFSLLAQGLAGFHAVHPVNDAGVSPKRAVIEFSVEQSEAVKFVGRWFDVNSLRFSGSATSVGPVLPIAGQHGNQRLACLVASPYANSKHVLALTCEPIPILGSETEILMFYGGFDPSDTMLDPMKEAGFLAFLYPVRDSEDLKERIGTVDFTPQSTPLKSPPR
jgi:hypothetical protein